MEESVDTLAEKNINVCSEDKKVFLCPNLRQSFAARVCCDSNWLAKGANLNTGDECMIDLREMERQCEFRTCYKSPEYGETDFWNTDGCTLSPDYMLSYEACVMHDLCYVTPGTTKKGCDDAMEENIKKIYCENVNYADSYSCAIRSRVGDFASKILSLTDRYYEAAAQEREGCELQDGYMTGTWKYVLRSTGTFW